MTVKEHYGNLLSTLLWPIIGTANGSNLRPVRRIPVPGGPDIVYATEQAADAKAKTLLCYGHYDLQPPEPLDK